MYGRILAFLLVVIWAAPLRADCSLVSIGTTPLSDSAAALYQGHPGGLYPGGRSTRPSAHEAAGIAIANGIVPLDAAGLAAPATGDIVMISIGLSNTRSEFAAFVSDAAADPSLHPRLRIVNGAQDGQPADVWANAGSAVWSEVDNRLTSAGLTPAQVQVAWVKLARAFPNGIGAFPVHAGALRDDLADVARNLKTHFPNIRLAYVSSRTRAYEDDPAALNPEPFAFESGFSVRWLIEHQLNGTGNLEFDSAVGPAVAPWLSWGPYFWADGTTPRSDGFTWPCSMTASDFIHPSNNGSQAVAHQLMAFFKTDSTTAPWFLDPSTVGLAPSCEFSVSLSNSNAPSIATFTDTSSDPDGTIVEYARTFDDGTFSFDTHPVKVFEAAGDYDVQFTVSDDSGNATRCTQVIAVPEPAAALSMMMLGGALAVLKRCRERSFTTPRALNRDSRCR